MIYIGPESSTREREKIRELEQRNSSHENNEGQGTIWSNESSLVSRVTFRFTINDLSGQFRMLKDKNCSFFSITVYRVYIYVYVYIYIYIYIYIYTIYIYTLYGLSQWFSSKESTCNAGDTGDTGLVPGLGRSPGEGDPLAQPTQVFLPGKSHGQRSLAGYSL